MAWKGWRKNDPRSEYGGRGVQANTLYPKGADALTPSDRLRLQSITGQEDDPTAPPDPYFWYGNVAPEESEAGKTELEILNEADPY